MTRGIRTSGKRLSHRCVTAGAVGITVVMVGIARASEVTHHDENVNQRLPLSRAIQNGTLYLELVVNGLSTGRVVPVRCQDDKYLVRAADLEKVSVRTDAEPDEMVDIGKLADVSVEYESTTQRLKLTVPVAWLPDQEIGAGRLYDRTPAAVNLGMLLNYDVYTSSPTRGSSATSVWTEQRIFDKWGAIVNTGVYRKSYGDGAGSVGDNRYLRYDTSWSFTNQNRLLRYTAGDVISDALSWTSAVRMGGISVARDFKVRPDIITYPLPQFSGQAAVPTAVDLFINGSKATSGQVNPGPFTLHDVPFINGAGEATVVTTDALGRQVSTTVPFYVANTLLQKGLSDFSVSAGAIRRDYGIRSFAYGKAALSSSARYGLTNDLTIEGHAEGGERFALGGIGFNTGVGRLGVVNTAVAQSRFAGESGQQYALGYSYASPRFSVALQRIQRTAGFRDLSAYDLASDVTYRLVRRSTQVTGALNLGAIGGTLGTGYFDVQGGDGSRTRIANVSYTRSLFSHATLYASLNKTMGDSGIAAQAQLIVPLGEKGTVTVGAARDENGNWSERTQYSRSVPSEGGIGWNLAYAGGGSRYEQADVTWRNRYLQVQGGAYGYGPRLGYTRWGELQGSLVAMDGAILSANRVDDSFVLVDTQGQKGVPVRYENQLIGTTDSQGHLLVPWAPAYYAAKYEIDPLGLPGNMHVPVTEQRIAVQQRAGALATFPIERMVTALIALVDMQGQPIKVGSRVSHRESGKTAPVGWGGETYFEGLSSVNHLSVSMPNGSQCTAMFHVDIGANLMNRIGPLKCNQ